MIFFLPTFSSWKWYIYTFLLPICLYLHDLMQHWSFCTLFVWEETNQLSVYPHIIMLSFLCHCTLCRYIWLFIPFFLQEELYSYCNRVKRSILEVSYLHIAVYKFYYLDKKICFISIWKQKSIDYRKKDGKRLFKSVS